MDDAVRVVEVGQAGDDGDRDLAQDRLRYPSDLLVDVVEGAVRFDNHAMSTTKVRIRRRGAHPLSIISMHMQI